MVSGSLGFSLLRLLGGHSRALWPRHILSTQSLSRNSVSPVPEAAGRPLVPPPLSQPFTARQVVGSPCQGPVSTPS